MPLDRVREAKGPGPLAERAARLEAEFGARPAVEILSAVLGPERGAAPGPLGRLAVVSSFGAESVVLLHLVATLAPATPILFIDTEMLFAETLAYQRQVAALLGLADVRVIRPDRDELLAADPEGQLHRADPDACCRLRKVRPLERALEGFDGWITGRKHHQAPTRVALPVFEAGADGRLRINPLARWSADDVRGWMATHGLPRHPLEPRGFRSIGCAPCTTPVAPGEDPRAGRWRGRDKIECGIHFIGGRVVRTGADAAASTSEEAER